MDASACTRQVPPNDTTTRALVCMPSYFPIRFDQSEWQGKQDHLHEVTSHCGQPEDPLAFGRSHFTGDCDLTRSMTAHN